MVNRPYRVPVPTWGLPGGSAAANELAWEALSRLLSERLTLKATAVGDLLVVDHVPEKPGELHAGTNYVYRVEIPDDAEPVVTESGRLGEGRWVERAAVGELAVDHSLRRIEQCLIADDRPGPGTTPRPTAARGGRLAPVRWPGAVRPWPSTGNTLRPYDNRQLARAEPALGSVPP
ncbi:MULTISPECIES: NUDIX domain-containing protein [unclassified Streptomyces]